MVRIIVSEWDFNQARQITFWPQINQWNAINGSSLLIIIIVCFNALQRQFGRTSNKCPFYLALAQFPHFRRYKLLNNIKLVHICNNHTILSNPIVLSFRVWLQILTLASNLSNDLSILSQCFCFYYQHSIVT